MYEIDKWKRFSNVWGDGWKKTLFWIYFFKNRLWNTAQTLLPKKACDTNNVNTIAAIKLGKQILKTPVLCFIGNFIKFLNN